VTVYVDDMYRHPMGRLGRMKMSHMVADTEAELHAMADKLGLKREWYQGDHYDISRDVRRRAVTLGAVDVTMRQLSAMMMLRRWGKPMGDPLTAMERLLNLKQKMGVE
jgi:uncharacterized protein DUF4031